MHHVLLSLTLLAGAPDAPTSSVRSRVIEAVRLAYSRQNRPTVIFDLEGTLFDSRPRTLAILKEYGERELRAVRPEAGAKLAALSVADVRYLLTDTLSAAGVTEPAVVNNAAVFWSERFFSDDYLRFDAPLPGAVAFVRELYSAGARIVYVSDRDTSRQLLGTVRGLRDHGFPIGIQGVELIMKPTTQTADAVFKQQLITYLRQYGNLVASFDGDAATANLVRRAFPDSICVLLGSPRAPNQLPLLPGVEALAGLTEGPEPAVEPAPSMGGALQASPVPEAK